MKGISLVALFLLLITAGTAQAGRIYGSLQLDGKAVAKGTRVLLSCAGKNYPPTEVKKHGRYSINADKNGSCSLSVDGFPGASIEVVSYSEATRYNLLLKRVGSGYTLQRN